MTDLPTFTLRAFNEVGAPLAEVTRPGSQVLHAARRSGRPLGHPLIQRQVDILELQPDDAAWYPSFNSTHR